MGSRYLPALGAAFIAAVLTACGHGVSAMQTTPGTRGTPSPAASLATAGVAENGGMTALAYGPLQLVHGCFQIGEPTVWPHGFRVGADGQSILSPTGRSFRVGQKISVGGGSVPLSIYQAPITNRQCVRGATTVWVAAGVG